MSKVLTNLRVATSIPRRVALLSLLAAVAIGAVLCVPPISQDPNYHQFADQRTLLHIPHALNVLSNLPFLVFGVMGVTWLFSPAGRRRGGSFLYAWEWWACLLLFGFVALTGFGSTYYHWNPSNSTLFWDRLPLTVVFMTFFALVLSERIDLRAGAWLWPPLVAVGVVSVTYWHWTEMQGAGDLRWYALVQFFPLVVLPILLLAFPPRYTGTAVLWAVLAWYGLAKLLELMDGVIYSANGAVSGHTLKHLVASLGVLWMLLLLRSRRPIGDSLEKSSHRVKMQVAGDCASDFIP